MQELYNALWEDLNKMGIDLKRVKLKLKPYSKTFYGRYDHNTKIISLFIFQDAELKKLYSYEHLLDIFLHEAIHGLQWCSGDFVRLKGIMHDTEFKRLYAKYSSKIKPIAQQRNLKVVI